MRENKEIYADLEKISQDYERDRIASLSPAEREQLNSSDIQLRAFLTLRLEKEIARQRVFREIARNVLQGLILDSGLNWASDPQLRDAMLMSGDEVEWEN